MVGRNDDGPQSKTGDMMKKILTVGLGAYFLTEESLRGLMADIKIPKEILSGILDSANKTKSEFLKNMSKEIMAQILERVDPKELLQELMSKNEIEVKVNLKFKPKGKGHHAEESSED